MGGRRHAAVRPLQALAAERGRAAGSEGNVCVCVCVRDLPPSTQKLNRLTIKHNKHYKGIKKTFQCVIVLLTSRGW